jgi:hypothetical protein
VPGYRLFRPSGTALLQTLKPILKITRTRAKRQLRQNLNAYDAAYVALSEELEAPLITRDRRIAAAPVHAATIELFQVTVQVGHHDCHSSLVMPSRATSHMREFEGAPWGVSVADGSSCHRSSRNFKPEVTRH